MVSRFYYRCRFCGEVFPDGPRGGSGIGDFLLHGAIATGRAERFGGTLYATTIHYCSDGAEGIADLVGYKEGE